MQGFSHRSGALLLSDMNWLKKQHARTPFSPSQSDDALAKYDAGDYAYWLASGISTEYDEKMVDDCIQLFCEENLSEQ